MLETKIVLQNWLGGVWTRTMSLKKFMEMEETLMEENKNSMDKIGLLEVDDTPLNFRFLINL